jgi:hypothetical protein
MQRRKITLEDGRYLIFYTFEEEAASPSSSVADVARDAESSSRRDEPVAEPQATEERRV